MPRPKGAAAKKGPAAIHCLTSLQTALTHSHHALLSVRHWAGGLLHFIPPASFLVGDLCRSWLTCWVWIANFCLISNKQFLIFSFLSFYTTAIQTRRRSQTFASATSNFLNFFFFFFFFFLPFFLYGSGSNSLKLLIITYSACPNSRSALPCRLPGLLHFLNLFDGTFTPDENPQTLLAWTLSCFDGPGTPHWTSLLCIGSKVQSTQY